ncbi:hypothetical protein A3Q56_00837 [Intoshia linei]|uniref:Uncharacterized protein n=1 Tax=Intoshia linei TaxID=1819745 RepID=A0A177BB02_9BILA|nr:hypothetical protein A3Q56_00837 [Intoshia linei]
MKNGVYSYIIFQAAAIAKLPIGYIANFLPSDSIMFVNPDVVKVILPDNKMDLLYLNGFDTGEIIPSVIPNKYFLPRLSKIEPNNFDVNYGIDFTRFMEVLCQDTIFNNSTNEHEYKYAIFI